MQWSQFQATKEAFTTLVICCKCQKTALNSVLYRFFYDFIHAGAWEDNSNKVNFERHRKLSSL